MTDILIATFSIITTAMLQIAYTYVQKMSQVPIILTSASTDHS